MKEMFVAFIWKEQSANLYKKEIPSFLDWLATNSEL